MSPVNTPYIPIEPFECSLPSRSADRPHCKIILFNIWEKGANVLGNKGKLVEIVLAIK